MRLSIIVPAFKVENYIEKCIRSLEDQDIPKDEYEIIVTNDGSPDESPMIVRNLQKEFPNIVLIDQENQGVSVARNNAIAKAKGNYIMPIDPDDHVLPNTFRRVLEKAESANVDVLYLGFEIFDANGHSIWHTDYSKQEQHIYEGVAGYYASRGNDVRDPDRSWAILYKREMIEKYELHYPKDVPFLEDGLFLGKVFSVAKRVAFDNGRFHQRTTSIGSATVSGVYYSEKAINGFLKAAVDIKAFGKKYIFTDEQKGLINHVTANFVLLSIFPLVAFKYIKPLLQTLQKIKKLGFSKLETAGVVNPYLQYAKYFNVSPYFFLVMYAKEMAAKKFSS
jgi:glycosyltransferase involved in cell wall biosynthesis